MSSEKKIPSLCDHEYYGPLIELYTKSILKSGLLLDEDLEVLLGVSNFKNTSLTSNYRPPLHLFGSIMSVLCASLLAKRYHVPLIVIPPIILTIKSVSSEIVAAQKRKNDKEIVNKLIESTKKVHRISVNIIRYMKTRTDLGKTKNSFLTLYNKGVKDFLEYLLSCECQLFQYLADVLQNISSYTPELRDDYTYLIALNPLDLLKTHNADNLEDCLLLACKIQDLHVLFASKLFSYFGIACNSRSDSLNSKQLDSLLDKTLPNLVKNLQQHHDAVKKRFTLLRQSINKKSEYKLQATVKPTNDKQIQAKLQETLACSVNNLSIILEKSQNLLDILEHTNQTDLSEISNAVIDLRNHSFATYESLDLICKLYGILANSSTNNQSQKRLSEVKQDGNVEPNFTIINCDDANEPLEENFELYIGDDDLTNDDSTTKYECERTDEYISLMLRELRQSLRQHQRFIDAKNRRGSDDDEEVVKKNSCVELRKSPPKFNLSVLKDSLEINDVSSTSSLDSDQRKDMPLHAPIPPPPPPPLPLPPSFQLDDLETESGQVNARSMLDNIKTLSSQRNVQEDVFGDSDVDSNSSHD